MEGTSSLLPPLPQTTLSRYTTKHSHKISFYYLILEYLLLYTDHSSESNQGTDYIATQI